MAAGSVIGRAALQRGLVRLPRRGASFEEEEDEDEAFAALLDDDDEDETEDGLGMPNVILSLL